MAQAGFPGGAGGGNGGAPPPPAYLMMDGPEAEVEVWDDLRAGMPDPILVPRPGGQVRTRLRLQALGWLHWGEGVGRGLWLAACGWRSTACALVQVARAVWFFGGGILAVNAAGNDA